MNYKFDRVQLRNSIYSPQAYGDLEREETTIRKLVLNVLSGENVLKMDVPSFPVDQEAVKLQGAVSKAMSEALNLTSTASPTDLTPRSGPCRGRK